MNLNDELQYNILLDEVDELELEMIELDEEIRIEELLEHERVLVINKINLQETLEQIRIDKDLQNAESVLDNIEAGIYYIDRDEFTKRLIKKKKKWLKDVIVGKGYITSGYNKFFSHMNKDDLIMILLNNGYE
tara:strand:+ start:246 stop:644 length:399 start_codon:yes stop_codon:yes gene_type:complete